MTPGLSMVEKPEKLSVSDLLADTDLSPRDLRLIFELAERVKASPRAYAQALLGKQLALIFEKPSLRTRVTFEVGMTSMGGFGVYLDHAKPRLGEREAVKDIARNLERWVDGIVARTFLHESVLELANNASIPVVNALTDLFHPCQALADLFTLREKFGALAGLKLAFVGDGNNVCHSLMITGAKLGVSVRVATPPGYEPNLKLWRRRKRWPRRWGQRSSFSTIRSRPWRALRRFTPMSGRVWARSTPCTSAPRCLRLIASRKT